MNVADTGGGGVFSGLIVVVEKVRRAMVGLLVSVLFGIYLVCTHRVSSGRDMIATSSINAQNQKANIVKSFLTVCQKMSISVTASKQMPLYNSREEKKKTQRITSCSSSCPITFFFVLAHAGLAWGLSLRQKPTIPTAEKLPHSYEVRASTLEHTIHSLDS